ncbi:hypothetical protein PO909_029197 [Leuciscus waleckii]
MGSLRVGSLNMNGGRDRQKREMVKEVEKINKLDVIFLQETHSTIKDEIDWGLSWGGQIFLNHGSNVSGGVAILFSSNSKINVVSSCNLVKGRGQMVKANIEGSIYCFINIYAPNIGTERIVFFNNIKQALELNDFDYLILDFVRDRNGEEPHSQSAFCLAKIIKNLKYSDVWRERNLLTRQFTWIKVTNGSVSGARLDRFYISHNMRNKIVNTNIFPTAISDHNLITFECILTERKHTSYYWHFNVKFLEDKHFCENFYFFWENWKNEKCLYENVIQWWEVGKAHIRDFCQQYASHTSLIFKKTLVLLEKEIIDIEKSMHDNNDDGDLQALWTERKNQLSSFLNEKVKGALVRSRFLTTRDMDGPSSFFFNLERKAGQEKLMYVLKDNNGHNTSDPEVMRKLAVDFYSNLYAAENSDELCRNQLLQDLPVLTLEHKDILETELTFAEVTAAVMGLSSGRTPGLDGLPAEFYKFFWNIIGDDYFEVIQKCINDGILPLSSQRAVLTLLPKKGDLTLLKNWRPIAILGSDYKIFSKCLASRVNGILFTIIHRDQSYCVKKRSMIDNLHLVRDTFDFASHNNANLGFLSLDQEKAFDRVDHTFLFDTLKAFGFGEKFISKIRLLYAGAQCMIKIAGGLSTPVKVNRGIRQGCPISGQLYSIVIEPLLCKLREHLTGLQVNSLEFKSRIQLSAYADDVTVLIKNHSDVQCLKMALECYGKASSAKINWQKSEAVWCGQDSSSPSLPGGLLWGKAGFKYLGVFLGTDEYRNKNWEGLVEKVCARLSHWKWLLPQLSYRGRILVCNNLVASSLWHKMMILEPPEDLVRRIQRCLVDFFWSGQHWLKAPVLYLPLQEGGQGLVDIGARVRAFRLQTAQRLLYGEDVSWAGIACTLLKRAGNMGFDRHLFLMDIERLDLSGLTSFYRSMLKTWTFFCFSRQPNGVNGLWLREEPLIFNPVLDLDGFKSVSLIKALRNASFTKIGHFVSEEGWISAENLALKMGLRSVRVAERLLTQIYEFLPKDYRDSLETPVGEEEISVFPELLFSPDTRTWQEMENGLLSFKTSQLGLFSNAGKKTIYGLCVKVTHLLQLQSVRETKWHEIFGPGASPKGCWRTLYKSPIEKRTGDLQWRIVHGIIATNRHRAHLDPQVGEGCPFCGVLETVFHLFFNCVRLQHLFIKMEEWCQTLGEVFTPEMFIYGPKYSKNKRESHVLLNYLFGQAKMAIWLTRKSKLSDKGSTDVFLVLKGLIKSRINIEYSYYKLINDLESFKYRWEVKQCICEVDSDECLQIYI